MATGIINSKLEKELEKQGMFIIDEKGKEYLYLPTHRVRSEDEARTLFNNIGRKYEINLSDY